jgi:hypothetical protein
MTSPTEPNNIIDIMPYIEGAKFGWTVEMTAAVLKHGTEETNRCLEHAETATELWNRVDRKLQTEIYDKKV